MRWLATAVTHYVNSADLVWRRAIAEIDRTRVSELVHHGEDGRVVAVGDGTALAATIEWYAAHREELEEMRMAAVEPARMRLWSAYRFVPMSDIGQAFGLPTAG